MSGCLQGEMFAAACMWMTIYLLNVCYPWLAQGQHGTVCDNTRNDQSTVKKEYQIEFTIESAMGIMFMCT